MNGLFGTFLNGGIIIAAPGAFALQTGPTAVGTTVVNNGIINGQVAVNSGPFTRFENSGLMGISAPGSGTTNTISGVVVQTPQGVIAPRIGATTADLVLVNGQARLAGGVLANFQGTSVGNNYAILTATGGDTGTFNAVATHNMAAVLTAH